MTRSRDGATAEVIGRELNGCPAEVFVQAVRWADADELTVPSGDRRVKVEQVRDLKRLLASTFPDKQIALQWLHREVPLLGGRRPIDLIKRGDLDPVVEALAGAHAGAFG